jgi:hypothetical protein
MKDLPQDYLVALLKFQHFLNQAASGSLGQLKVAVAASPPMHKFFVREPPDGDNSAILVKSRPEVKKTKAEENLIWLLRTLWENDNQLFLARLPLVVDELERLIQAEP